MTTASETFRALATSSPWLFQTLHLTHRDGGREVEAWLRRPTDLVVRDGDRLVREQGPPHSSGGWARAVDLETGRSWRVPSQPPVFPAQVEPVRREDGLVVQRPDGVEYGDPMHGDYRFVASLDPVELASGTAVDQVGPGERLGRPVLTALVTPLEDYDPRCGCCPLLFSEISERHETEGSDVLPWHERHPGGRYPDAYRVSLDRATGVVVELRPVGGHGRHDLDLSIDIHAVDVELDEVIDAVPAPREEEEPLR